MPDDIQIVSGSLTEVPDVAPARRRVERIRLLVGTVQENMAKILELVHEAKASNDHMTLGYRSWPAFIADLFGDEPLRLTRDVRQELVAELAAQGMSSRAIAPIVGVSPSTVKTDAQVASSGQVAEDPAFDPMAPLGDSRDDDWTAADPVTGEVIEVPITTTETHTVKTTIGIDGKTYKQKAKAPKEPMTHSEADLDNAKQNSIAIGKALATFEGITVPAHRSHILNDWWPLGKEFVPPFSRKLFNPAQLRHIAESLNQLATEMEAHK